MRDLIILILSSNTYPSKRNEKILRRTWANIENSGFQSLFYSSGKQFSYSESSSEIVFKTGTSVLDIGHRTLKMFEWLLENTNYEYFFRTNTSSYIKPDKLREHIEHINNDKYLYAGHILKKYENSVFQFNYASGAGYLINRKTLSLILENKEDWDHTEIDDVSLGKLLSNRGIEATSLKREEVNKNFFLQDFNSDSFHIRTRLDQIGYPRFLERIILKHLFQTMTRNRKYNKFYLNLMRYFFYINEALYIQNFVQKILKICKSILKFLLPIKIYNSSKIFFMTVFRKKLGDYDKH